jgi:hypothetical protein
MCCAAALRVVLPLGVPQVDALAAQKNAVPAEAPAAGGASEGNLKLQLEIVQQQKELEQLKQQKTVEAVAAAS